MTELAVRNRRAAFVAGLIALAMVGLGYASVPLYRIFCQATGLNGTTSRVSEAELPRQATGETVMVRFDANIQLGLPWVFRPEKPGHRIEIASLAEVRP